MTEATKELDTAKEEAPSVNGHSDEWLEFDDDLAFLNHISSQKPAEEVVPIVEWKTKVLCKALGADSRIEIEMIAYDKELKNTDYRRAFYEVIAAGCFNPKTGKKAFTKSHRTVIMRDGGPATRLFLAVLRLSNMLSFSVEQTRKN